MRHRVAQHRTGGGRNGAHHIRDDVVRQQKAQGKQRGADKQHQIKWQTPALAQLPLSALLRGAETQNQQRRGRKHEKQILCDEQRRRGGKERFRLGIIRIAHDDIGKHAQQQKRREQHRCRHSRPALLSESLHCFFSIL